MKNEAIIPRLFRERYNKICPNPKQFFKIIQEPLKPAIRINTNKISREEIISRLEKQGWKLKQTPFYENGFVIENAPNDNRIGLTIEHFMGYFYIQEVVSMLPAVVLAPRSDDLVLDVCAAPGSKTTQMSQMIGNTGLIIANDNDFMRLKPLKYNIEKCGCLNVAITNIDGRVVKGKFDKILLDAPCSSEGQIRKDWKVLSRWSEEYIKTFSNLQKQLIKHAFEILKPNGTLVYSTCTFAPEENEEVVSYLLDGFGNAQLEEIKLKDFKTSEGITEWQGKRFNPEVRKCIRIWPHQNDTGGFFVAKVRKC
ncbi:MAG: RsmB/NOP family class I SAM-dependent RNA methyltransferase [Nanoarchaeota archaeon]